MLAFCAKCNQDVKAEEDESNGFSCCTLCGNVLQELHFTGDVQFSKDQHGAPAVSGQFIRDGKGAGGALANGRYHGAQVDSHEKSIEKGRDDICMLLDSLDFKGAREHYEEAAVRFYTLALNKGFTKGRKIIMVAAACLYAVCRKQNLPYLLMDFSDATSINVYTLGSVYVSLCSLLSLDTVEVFQRPVDPTLYMIRYASRLGFGDMARQVSNTATRIVSSMKRDWMHTGRRPSGICGAALLIAAHIHGFETTRRQVISVVHIGSSTLGKRVDEFGATRAGDLTLTDFDARCREEDQQLQDLMARAAENREPAPDDPDLHCPHIKDDERPHFAKGMCEQCFRESLKLSGVADGEDPPAYRAALLKQREAEAAEEERRGILGPEDEPEEYAALMDGDDGQAQLERELNSALLVEEIGLFAKTFAPEDTARAAIDGVVGARAKGEKAQAQDGPGSAECATDVPITVEGAEDLCDGAGGQIVPYTGGQAGPSETTPQPLLAIMPAGGGEGNLSEDKEELSDLEDSDVEDLFYTPEESRAREECWKAANQDWIEKSRLKAEAAARQAEALAKAGTDASGVPQKRGRGRPPGSRSKVTEEYAEPAATAAEATLRMLDSKKLSHKINPDVVASLYDNNLREDVEVNIEPPAKQRKVDGESTKAANEARRQKRREDAAQKRRDQAAQYRKALPGEGRLEGLGIGVGQGRITSLSNTPSRQRIGSLF